MPTSKQRSGKRLCKPVQPGRIHHRCRNGDDSFILTAQLEEFVGEQLGPGLPRVPADGLTGRGVDLADRVEVVLHVVLRGLETVALAGEAVHQNWTAELLGLQ